VTCDAELHGTVGNLGLEKPAELALHTYGPLKLVKLEPSGNDIVPDESVRLVVSFTNPLKAPYQMKLVPPASGFPQRCYSAGDESPGSPAPRSSSRRPATR